MMVYESTRDDDQRALSHQLDQMTNIVVSADSHAPKLFTSASD